MTSRKRRVEPGYIYHVLNRGAYRQKLFFADSDYADFEELIQNTIDRTPLSILTYELMPNHWHFVVKPQNDEEMSEFFQYLAGTHAKRFRAFRNTTGEGHVYQDRFKSFPVNSDEHFLTVCRYVERNALRAGLADRAEQWRWSALWRRLHGCDDWLTSAWPVQRSDDWIDYVNMPLTEIELKAIRRCIRRGRPYGNSQWTHETAERLGLMHSLRSPGRPAIASNPGSAAGR